MNRYICTVSDSSGKITRLRRTAPNPGSLQISMREEGFYPVAITRVNSGKFFKKKRIGRKALAEFTSALSVLAGSGVTIRDALNMMESVNSNPDISSAALKAGEVMKEGNSFSFAMESVFPELPPIYTMLLKTADITGEIGTALNKLTSYLAETGKIREKVLISSVYPAFILGVLLLTLLTVSIYIIPGITAVFENSGMTVPDEVIRASRFSRLFPVITAAAAGLSAAAVIAVRPGSLHADRILVSVPVIGPFLRDIVIVRILFAMDSLLSSGISIADSLDMVKDTSGNILAETVLERIINRIRKGESLSEALSPEKTVPKEIIKWITVGESTGDPGKIFAVLAEYFKNDLDRRISRASSAMEPLLTIFFGLSILLIALLVFIPLLTSMGGIIR